MNMEKQLIYISGPISHRDPTERRKAFAATAAMLRGHGFDVVNPMENGLPYNASTYQHMRRDFEMLMVCDIIYMMKGWTHRFQNPLVRIKTAINPASMPIAKPP